MAAFIGDKYEHIFFYRSLHGWQNKILVVLVDTLKQSPNRYTVSRLVWLKGRGVD